jgi:hypothetical protein
LEIGSPFLSSQLGPWYSSFKLFTITEMTGRCHKPSFFQLRWGFVSFLPRLALHHDPPNFSLLWC